MRGKYLSVFGDYAESFYAYMEKMANWGYLRYTKSSPSTRKVSKRIRRIRGKNFFCLLYSALVHLLPLRFRCAGGCWDRTQDRCNWCIGSQTL
jgi:hypothetical protein